MIHKIVLLFIVIFIVGIYYFTIYINKTINDKKDSLKKLELNNSILTDKEVIQVN